MHNILQAFELLFGRSKLRFCRPDTLLHFVLLGAVHLEALRVGQELLLQPMNLDNKLKCEINLKVFDHTNTCSRSVLFVDSVDAKRARSSLV